MLKVCDVAGSGGDKLDKFSAYHLVYILISFFTSLLSLVFVCGKVFVCGITAEERMWLKGKLAPSLVRKKVPLFAKSEIRTTVTHIVLRQMLG
jgi:hypothetical protein